MKKILILFILSIQFIFAAEVTAKGKLYGDFIELTYSGSSYNGGSNGESYIVEYIPIDNISSFARYKSRNSTTEEYVILASGYLSTEYQTRYFIQKDLFEELLEKSRVSQNKKSEFEKANRNILKSTNP